MATACGMASDSTLPSTTFQGRRPASRRSEPTMKTGVDPAGRRAPFGKADHDRGRVGDAVHRQGAKALAFVEQRGVLEALRAVRHDPEVGRRMVDHGRDHALEAEVEAHLHGHEHDREHDADDRRDQSQPIVKQVAGRESKDQRHGLFDNPI